jgi:hypothetical protein
MIITTINQIQAVIPNITAELEFTDFQTYIESAEHWIKKEIIGDDIYEAVEDAIKDPELIRMVQNIIVLKAYDTAIPFLDLIHTASGFGVVNDQNRVPASAQRVERLIAQNKKRLDSEVESLIDYLEAETGYHDEWKASPAYSILSDCIIFTANEFSRYSQKIERSAFLKLKPVMIGIQKGILSEKISSAYVNELLAEIQASNISTENETVLPLIKRTLALLTISEGLETMLITLDDNGVYRNYEVGKTNSAGVQDLNMVRIKYHEMAVSMLNNLINYMVANEDDYPTYMDSDEKVNTDDAGYTNAEDDQIFVFKGGL